MKRFYKICLTAILIVFIVCLCGLLYAVTAWGNYDPDKLLPISNASRFYDMQSEAIESSILSRTTASVQIDELPPYVYQAFLAAEDQDFYQHFGINPKRIVSALIYDIRTRSRAQGASTITQQLVKLTHLTSEKTFARKLKEAYYAILIERDYDKDEILAMYLDTVYFGAGAYGLEAASQVYFDCEARALTPGQAACLAATLKAPSNYAPHLDAQANETRRQYVIDEMETLGFLTPDQAQQAREEQIILSVQEKQSSAADWFIDQAALSAADILGVSYGQVISGGYRIMTTMDPALQNAFDIVIQDDSYLPPDAPDGTRAQCAAIAMEKNGAVRACIGGRNYEMQLGLNRATDAKRQPGSVLKPLAVYAPAFEENRITTATFLSDEPTDFNGYTPSNYGGAYYGAVTVRTAFAKSLNVPAVGLMAQTGPENACQYLNRFGIETTDSDAYLPLAVGSMGQGVSPAALCGAYLSFLNGGIRPQSYWVEAIYDAQGTLLYQHHLESVQAISSDTAALITSLMQSTAAEGTARRLAAWGYPVAAKTGTVGYAELGNRDAWAAVLTPNHAFTVWTGFDETTDQTYLDASVTGGSYPVALMLQVLSTAYPHGDGGEFVRPATVVECSIDNWTLMQTGQIFLATDITPPEYVFREVFSVENCPTIPSEYWQIPDAPTDLHVRAAAQERIEITFTASDARARYRLYRQYGNTVVELGTFEGVQDTPVVFYDSDLQWLREYAYFVTAEHAAAVDAGMNNAIAKSGTVLYRTPIFSFFAEDFYSEDTPNPTIPKATFAPELPFPPSGNGSQLDSTELDLMF